MTEVLAAVAYPAFVLGFGIFTVVLLLILGVLAVTQFNYIEKRVHYQ